MQGANMEEIVKMAQQVASNIAQNQTESIDPQNMDMGKVISQVTQSVSKMITPEMVEKLSGAGNDNNTGIDEDGMITNAKGKKIKSKINLDTDNTNNAIEELDDEDSECKPLAPRTKDLHFTLNVTLEELYAGKLKKLAVRRKRLITDGKKENNY